MQRRTFIQLGLGAAASGLVFQNLPRTAWAGPFAPPAEPFKISLAQWSLNNGFFGRGGAEKLDPLNFANIAQSLGIEGLEYVNQFYRDKSGDRAYLAALKKRADDLGRTSVLIMVDGEGDLGAPDAAERQQAVENHYKWLDWAAYLGAHGIRVNAHSDGTYEEQQRLVTDGLRRLGERGQQMGLNVFVENHGGLSSDAEWLVGAIQAVNLPNVGTLPDFGNFGDDQDPYLGTELMMPYAKGVSAKSRFTPDGRVTTVDYDKMMRIVRDGGWTGWVGIESGRSEGVSEMQAVQYTKNLLDRIRAEQMLVQPILVGNTLAGWKVANGGSYVINDGHVVLSDGSNWSTDPEVAGSWMYYDEPLRDFHLEFQYKINPEGNSGVMFRSALERNPAYNGYELQISSRNTPEPSDRGTAGAIYRRIAPTKDTARPAGQWNTVTLIARGPDVTVDMNHERIVDGQVDGRMDGYVGFQNHDAESVVEFKNVRLQKL